MVVGCCVSTTFHSGFLNPPGLNIYYYWGRRGSRSKQGATEVLPSSLGLSGGRGGSPPEGGSGTRSPGLSGGRGGNGTRSVAVGTERHGTFRIPDYSFRVWTPLGGALPRTTRHRMNFNLGRRLNCGVFMLRRSPPERRTSRLPLSLSRAHYFMTRITATRKRRKCFNGVHTRKE